MYLSRKNEKVIKPKIFIIKTKITKSIDDYSCRIQTERLFVTSIHKQNYSLNKNVYNLVISSEFFFLHPDQNDL